MVRMVETEINGRWTLLLPEHRHARVEWPHWEAQRLAAEHHVIATMTEYGDVDNGVVHSPVVYCVGAEEGDFPALYASWGADVAMFEPNERVWPNIRAIFEANRLERSVLGTFVGFAGPEERHLGDQLNRPGSIWPECAYGAVIGDPGFCNLWERPDIAVVQLDTVAAVGASSDQLVPDMVTIDVEGAELQVLRSAATILRTAKPVVFVSIHPDFMRDGYNTEPDELHSYMAGHGYAGRFLCTDHEEHWVFQHPDNVRMPT